MGDESEANGCGFNDLRNYSIFQSNWFRTVSTFQEMNLDNDLLESVLCDFEKPFLVQQKGIQPCIEAHDVIMEAPTGSGKTTAAVISLLQLIDFEVDECQALILVPDSKTAAKVHTLVSILSDFAPNFKCHVCDDEHSLAENRRSYDLGAQILVGTPAHVLQLLVRDSQEKKNRIQIALLDKVDELLVDAHKNDVYALFGSHLCWCSQIIVLSTSLPKELTKFKEDFMNETIQIILKKDDLFSFQGVKQFYLNFDDASNKFSQLNSLCDSFCNTHVLIFCNSRRSVDELTTQMKLSGRSVLSMHVEPSTIRRLVVSNFLVGSCNFLITSDHLGSEYSLPKSVVVNYDLPRNATAYRTRLGHEFGCSRNLLVVNFVSNSTKDYLSKIELFYNTSIPQMPDDFSEFIKELPAVKTLSLLKNDLFSLSSTEIVVQNGEDDTASEKSVPSKKRKIMSKN